MIYKNLNIRILHLLIYFSFFTAIFDVVLGLEIFLFHSDALSIVYRILFFFKFLLVFIALLHENRIKINFFILFLVFFIVTKTLLGLSNISVWYFLHIYFYSFIVLGYFFAANIADSELHLNTLSKKTILPIFYLTLLLIFVYYFLFLFGYINYFGIGVHWHIFVPYFLSTNSSNLFLAIALFGCLLTGKRGSLLIFLSLIGLRKFTPSLRYFFFIMPLILILVISIAFYIGLLDRFVPILDLFLEADFEELPRLYELLYFATSGRSDEIISYLFSNLDATSIVFGQLPGHTFYLYDTFHEEYHPHYFLHFSPANIFFHFGLIGFIPIMYYQIKVFLWTISEFRKTNNLIYGLFQGYFLLSMFGAIIVVDILFWICFFYSYIKMKSIENPQAYLKEGL